jgi:hypothetical protein
LSSTTPGCRQSRFSDPKATSPAMKSARLNADIWQRVW